jgi:hypothetical protein
MAGESDEHLRLKESACWWLWNQGFRAVAAEVPVPGIGIVDATAVGCPGAAESLRVSGSAATGLRRRSRRTPSVWQAVFVECKAFRSDFLRDAADAAQLRIAIEERANLHHTRQRGRAMQRSHKLGKFAACLARPTANVHWVLTPPGLIRKDELPLRWGLLETDDGGIRVTVPAHWQTTNGLRVVEASIARTLTASIYAADTRAITNSVNRMLRQKQAGSASRMTQALGELGAM